MQLTHAFLVGGRMILLHDCATPFFSLLFASTGYAVSWISFPLEHLEDEAYFCVRS